MEMAAQAAIFLLEFIVPLYLAPKGTTMAKALLRPTGDFMLILDNGEYLHSHRPSVVTMSSYVESKIAAGQIKTISKLPDTATDKDFEKFWEDSERNEDLAVQSYLSSVGGKREDEATPTTSTTTPTKTSKPAEEDTSSTRQTSFTSKHQSTKKE